MRPQSFLFSRPALFVGALFALAVLINGCDALTDTPSAVPATPSESTTETVDGELRNTMHGRIVVANRASGTASVISTPQPELPTRPKS